MQKGNLQFVIHLGWFKTLWVKLFKRDTETPVLLPEKDWFDVDVISCAAPNLAALDLRYLLQHDKNGKRQLWMKSYLTYIRRELIVF